MQNTFDTTQIRTGTSVYGSDGEKIGDVAGVADRYFVIEKGFLFTTDIYVPLSAVASADEDGITLSMTKDEVENNDWSSEPTDDDGDTAFADTSDDTYATSANTTAQGDMLERREERLVVDKDVEQTGNVSVGKRVVEQRQSVDVPVTREEVTIDRRSVDRPATGEALTEDSIDVPLYEERVETGKEARVVEELEIGKTAVTDTAHVEDTVRREEFDIDENTGDTTRQNR
ncbi:MAG TPA: DUF2382 domain-containing protein [Actinomycetes bacterium]|nr:DUF2382 domain-containing protein [Actinomycetes bacterium]